MGGSAPLDREEFARWRAEADRALESARIQADADLHNWSWFASEQAAQLAIKALLHGLGRAPWGHDLVRLAESAREAGIDQPQELLGAIRRLGRHYIPARYPDAHAAGSAASHYDRTDAVQALSDAEAVLEFVDRTWASLR